MKIELLQGKAAEAALQDDQFRKFWDSVYTSCSWATSMQSLAFVETWYQSYEAVYELFLVIAKDETDQVVGILPLAMEKESKLLTFAGAHLCEYPTWLATEGYTDSFIVEALEKLAVNFPNQKLKFQFLAKGTPLGWLEQSQKWRNRCELIAEPHPVIALENGEELQEAVQKKKYRTRVKQLEKLGLTKLENIDNAQQLESVFEEVQNYGDFRLSAVHQVPVKTDPYKKGFYSKLQECGLLHATLFKVGNTIASAQFNLHNHNEVLLGLSAHSPFYAKHSPSKFHITQLSLKLFEQGISIFDLTPGGGYKERYANRIDEIKTLTVYFSRAQYLRQIIKRKMSGIVKTLLNKRGMDKDYLNDKVNVFKHKAKHFNLVKTTSTAFRILKNKVLSTNKKEMRIYIYDKTKMVNLDSKNMANRNSISDLLKYEPAESWQLTTSQFHQMALKRLEDGNQVYTIAENNKLLHYGWLGLNQEISHLSEVHQSITLLPNSAVLYDFYTHPEARGKRFYQNSLVQILQDVSLLPHIERAYIAVLGDNVPSRHVIEKVGFDYTFSVTKTGIFYPQSKEMCDNTGSLNSTKLLEIAK